jgi:hypothetical protein
MDNYKEMYFKLFDKLSKIVEEIKQTQLEAEDMYVSQSDND